MQPLEALYSQIDIDLTFEQFRGKADDEFELQACQTIYVLKGGKQVRFFEYPQLKGIEVLPDYENYTGLTHLALINTGLYALNCEISLDTLPFRDENGYHSYMSKIRKSFEQHVVAGLKERSASNSNSPASITEKDFKSYSYRMLRFLAGMRSHPLADGVIYAAYNWTIHNRYIDDFILEHSIALSLELDNLLIFKLGLGGSEWLEAYTLCNFFEIRLTRIYNQLGSNEGRDIELGRKTRENMSRARKVARIKGKQRREIDEDKRLAFATSMLIKNPSLSAKDLARKYRRTESGLLFKRSTLETYFQKTRTSAMSILISKSPIK